jgi:hypothetical protein
MILWITVGFAVGIWTCVGILTVRQYQQRKLIERRLYQATRRYL